MPIKPTVSVVIATYNRKDTLKITLEKLAKQTVPASCFEVLVVDDESPDGTPEMIQSMMPFVPYTLRYFRHQNRGPGYTQNQGIRLALSDLILFIPDDLWITPQLIEQHLKTHQEKPEENFAVLGKVLQSPDLPPTVIHKYWDPFMFHRFEGKRELDSIFFFACNISVKKNFLLNNGMYKEREGAAHEDIELGYRLGQKGLRIIYNEKALGYHYHIETLTGACRRAYHRGRNLDVLYKNIPKPLVFSLYHIFTPEAGWKVCTKMLPREIPRAILFNKLTINVFWIHVLQRAETSCWAQLFANGITYRGTIYYHLRAGYKKGKAEVDRSM